MANGTDTTMNTLGESFGNFEDITETISFSYWIVETLDSIIQEAIFLERAKNNPLMNHEQFFELYNGSKEIFIESLDYYDKLTRDPENPIHAKQLINLLYDLYQAGLTGTLGATKRNVIKDFWKRLKNLGNTPLKVLLLLLKLINDYLGSLSKALQCADALDEAKKFGEHIITASDLKEGF